MLQKLRDKTSGWFATVVLALLTVPFAFFGMEQYLFARNVTFAAKIEAPPQWWPSAPQWWPVTMLWQREEIDANDFKNAFEQARQQQRQVMGEQFDPQEFETMENKRKTLDRLIDEKVLAMAAGRAGIAVGDAQVRDAIQAIPAFQVDGKFDAQRYQLALSAQSPPMTPQTFQQRIRDSLQQSLVPTQLAQSAFVTAAETERLLKLLGQKRDVSFVIVPPAAEDTAPVSDADAQKWFQDHQAEYRAPETVTIEYVDVDGSTLPAATAAMSESDLRKRYDEEIKAGRFVEPEQRLTSHILVQVPAGADAKTQKAAEDKAKKLDAEARQPGADFAALARANSDDAGSKASGGDLGWVTKGNMVAPFENALFAMKAGEISQPVKSEFGWHIIQLREVKTGQQTPFEVARAQLEKESGESERERAFNDLTTKFYDQVLKNPTALAPAAASSNLPVQKLGPITKDAANGQGIAANPAVLRAAFSDSLIQDGTVSDPIEIGPNHNVFLRVTEHSPERAQTLAQVKDKVIAAIRADRRHKAAEAQADAMVAKLKAGESLATIAAAQKLAVQDVPGLPRTAPVPDPAATKAYFEAPAPAAGKVSPGKASLPDGSIVVFAVTKVTPGDPKEAGEPERMQLRQQFGQLIGTEDATSLVEALRKRMKITVAEERL
ncbi:SurA N-terminal domain-containing protein [Luteimonas panaciterrae]|uniref:SurA N-terminal domain-containing protein n=1 Tax=Luteimonas panaciterrae TaxID=363885 RepID=UPI001CFAAFDE|nr:SurA N-terminal domain-containing protein [Luteimonas panaciterrae]